MQQQNNFRGTQMIDNSIPFERGIQARINSLKQEREQLEEEIRQLKVAVQIYTEVARRRAVAAGAPDTGGNPVWAA